MRTRKHILEVIAEELALPTVDAKSAIDLIDSLDLIGVISQLEGQFGVKIPNHQISKLKTFGDLVKVVQDA